MCVCVCVCVCVVGHLIEDFEGGEQRDALQDGRVAQLPTHSSFSSISFCKNNSFAERRSGSEEGSYEGS